ncbi:hypothetical protein, partial [Nocardioides aquiterrae]|uniref:hypothetical protein n=1 Tax=Nocardioides aquiterrae TaxID=203799 RepID=UPI0031E2757C
MSPASAHTPMFSADCGGVRVSATAYDSDQANRWSVTIGGVTETGTFGSSFDRTFPVPQEGATTSWSAFVEAQDGSYHGERAGSVGPCGTPVDDCADLPGNQPVGTPCAPPPDVTRTDGQALEGCAVAFAGTAYGAGALTYDEEYTDTYVFDEQANTWNLVTDTTATVTDVVFTPWSIAEQVRNGCADKPKQPPATHESHSTSNVDCDSDVIRTTTTTVTTPFVYDAATNTWVAGQPHSNSTTEESPVQPGDCAADVSPSGVEAETASATAPGGSSPSLVPTSIEAGAVSAAPAA